MIQFRAVEGAATMARLKKQDPTEAAGMAASVPVPGALPSAVSVEKPVVLYTCYDAMKHCLAYDDTRQILASTNRSIVAEAAGKMGRGVICKRSDLSSRIDAGFPVVPDEE